MERLRGTWRVPRRLLGPDGRGPGAGSPGRPHTEPLSRSGPGGHPEGRSGAEDGGAVDAPGVLQLSGVFQVVMGDHLPHDLA